MNLKVKVNELHIQYQHPMMHVWRKFVYFSLNEWQFTVRTAKRTDQTHWPCANCLIHECVGCDPHFCGVPPRCSSVNPSVRYVWGATWGIQSLVVQLFVRPKCNFVGCNPKLSVCLSVNNVASKDAHSTCPSTCPSIWVHFSHLWSIYCIQNILISFHTSWFCWEHAFKLQQNKEFNCIETLFHSINCIPQISDIRT